MKNQALFSSKDKSIKLKCGLLQFLFGTLRVKSQQKEKTGHSFSYAVFKVQLALTTSAAMGNLNIYMYSSCMFQSITF